MDPRRQNGATRASCREVRGNRDDTDAGAIVIDDGDDLIIRQIEESRRRIRARLGRLDQGSWFLTREEC